MNPKEVVQEALRSPSNADVRVDAYDEIVSNGVADIVGNRVPAIIVTLRGDSNARHAQAALTSENIRPIGLEYVDEEEQEDVMILISVAQLEDESIVLDLPEAKDFGPTLTSEGVYYPAERVELRPNHLVEETGGRDELLHGNLVRYLVSFTDTRGDEHDLVHHFGNPRREDMGRVPVPARDLWRVVECLRKYGVGTAAVEELNLDDDLAVW